MVATTLVTVFLSHAFPRDPALQPLSFVFTFVPRPSLKILSPVATHPPSREISSLGDIAPPLPPPREKFKRGGNLRDSLPPLSWNKRGTAQSRQKISKSLDKGVLETPSLPPSLPPLPLQLSSSIGPSCHCGASRKRKRELWTMFSIYLSWCWTYQGASFRDEILFNCKINRGEISGINSTGYWLCENAW